MTTTTTTTIHHVTKAYYADIAPFGPGDAGYPLYLLEFDDGIVMLLDETDHDECFESMEAVRQQYAGRILDLREDADLFAKYADGYEMERSEP